MKPDRHIPERIVDAALELAAVDGWEAVRLVDVAAATGLSLEDIRQHFREKEALVEAFFDRADRAMLEVAASAEFKALPSRERVHRAIMVWLDTLAPWRSVVRQMILNKLEPGHLHVQIPALLRVSRTVQWVREAAGRRATFMRRAVEESILTAIYLTTFVHWMRDDSSGAQDTRRLLGRLLKRAQSVEGLVGHIDDRAPEPAHSSSRRNDGG